jgi:hypothetical protein
MRFGVLAALLAACSGGDERKTDPETGGTPTETGGAETGPATLRLSFDLDSDLIAQMDEPAAGVFRGSIYAEADASAIGPNDGAAPLLDFTSDALDFGTAGGALPGGAPVGPLDPQIVWVLGCFDTAGDDCECGDPITIPNENKLQITPGEGDYTVTMSLLHPC